ncbi:MAG: bifunctional isocitrate dehydrogenase kinase/phosphatase [Desulfobacterales bacterium]|jgi:isocitrate dehydrogenase kinase/phosphatase
MILDALVEKTEAHLVGQIARGYLSFREAFDEITRRAPDRFRKKDWAGAHQDVVDRIEIYKQKVDRCVSTLQGWRENEPRPPSVEAAVKDAFLRRIETRPDTELAKTFFNSVIRRVLSTVGVNPDAEFVDEDFGVLGGSRESCEVCSSFPARETIGETLRNLLESYREELRFSDLDCDVELTSAVVNTRVSTMAGRCRFLGIEALSPVFYQNQAAYIIGTILLDKGSVPLVLAVAHDKRGVYVDAVLMSEVEVSILLSFTRSYFRVLADDPRRIVRFLKGILPAKPISELYTAIGFHKHGKAELFRELQRHLNQTTEKFHVALGERGMVMAVFTMPSFDVVFKVIRDHFDYPKTTNARKVMDKYGLVFRHDRAGRLVEAQEFEHLAVDRRRFTDNLLAYLGRHARRNVHIESESVVLRHVYTERQIIPLDVYLQQAEAGAAREAVRDYGRAIKELAFTNIFPGDLFMKNFGVTRHGRVVFYDYDELCLITECRFRRIPEAREPESEMASTPWFFVDENDVFPEEFPSFLGLPGDLMAVFEKEHGELFSVEFWLQVQSDLKAGKHISLFPYARSSRLPRFPGKRPCTPPGRKRSHGASGGRPA